MYLLLLLLLLANTHALMYSHFLIFKKFFKIIVK